jgi:hypothetical protein
VLGEDQRGHEEKSPIKFADAVIMMGRYSAGNRGPRTPGVGEVFLNQEVQLDSVDNGEATRLSGMGTHIVSTGAMRRNHPFMLLVVKMMGDIAWVTEDHERLVWEKCFPIRRCSWTTWITVEHHGCLEWEEQCPT